MIVSRHHEWRTHPAVEKDATSWPAKHMVKCVDCGAVAIIGEWSVPRCLPKHEAGSSGFREDSEQRA